MPAASTAALSSSPPGLTRRHWVYLIAFYGLGAAALDGALNFLLALLMYKPSSHPVDLWRFPNTLAGDLAVTILIEVTLTWVITAASVCNDVRKNKVAAVHSTWLERLRNTNRFNWMLMGHLDLLEPGIPCTQRCRILGSMTLRGLLLCIPAFVLFWPLAVGIVAGSVANVHDIRQWPDVQIIKLTFGAALGFVITPAIAYFALVRMGWRMGASNSGTATSRMHSVLDGLGIHTQYAYPLGGFELRDSSASLGELPPPPPAAENEYEW